MSIDVREYGNGFEDLRRHIGHKIECVCYGKPNEDPLEVSIECEDCGEVIFSLQNHEGSTCYCGSELEFNEDEGRYYCTSHDCENSNPDW